MTVYSWTVVINKIPYAVTCRDPWTAASRVLRKYCKEHPKSQGLLFDIYVVNRTLADKGKVISEVFNRHRKDLLAGVPDLEDGRSGDGKEEKGR